MPTINPLRDSAELLEAMAVGSVKLASEVATESPAIATDARTALTRANNLVERRNWLDDAEKAAGIAELLHRLADRADWTAGQRTPVATGENYASLVSDAAAEYSERLDRIQQFVIGFRNVPGSESWFEKIAKPILKMAAGEKQ